MILVGEIKMQEKGHTYGSMESMKFDYRREKYYEYIDYLKKIRQVLRIFYMITLLMLVICHLTGR